MIGQILQNRYLIDSELGRGGMGVVYRATDRLLDRQVAVKVIADTGIGTSGKARLLAEAQSAARINHPNIVAVYDVGEAEGITYLVMELIEGESLRKVSLRHDLQNSLRLAIQVCTALEQAHAQGVIHRDLKPENIMVTPAQNAKLMDFGLARRVDTPQMTEEGSIVGTFAYIAPEIIGGGQASPQSDLYALGLILYEMTTGQPAYSGQDLLTILSQHLHATVTPPTNHNPALPLELEALILRLLEKQPQDRPASAAEVRQTLEIVLAGGSQASQTLRAEPEAALERIVRGRLVARESELSQALALWKQTLLGTAATNVLLVSGEPGIGKTRLVKELVMRAGLAGATILNCECYAHGGAPYAPLAQTIENAPLDTLSPLVIANLVTLAPGLSLRFPDLTPSASLDPQGEQERLIESYTTFCSHLLECGPLLLVMDDAHWADGGSLALLRQLVRRSARAHWKLLLVLTYREVELAESRSLNDLIGDLTRERLSERLKLGRLTRSQTGALLNALFSDQVGEALQDSIYHETEGNPFFVEEVCKALVEQGQIYRENGRWQRRSAEIELPQSVRMVIENRLGRLPEAAQETLRLAAILGRRFEFETLQATSDQSEEALIEALEHAERSQLLQEIGSGGGGTFSFTHALIPSTLADGLSGLRRRRLHRKAAETLERLHPDDYEALAHHYSLAADDERALNYAIKAAERAHKLYANDDAIRFYSEALGMEIEDQAQRFHLLLQRSEVYGLSGRRQEQWADLQAARSLSDKLGPAEQCDALILIVQFHIDGKKEEALAPGEQAMELARGMDDKTRLGRALGLMGFIYLHLNRDMRAFEYYQQAVACLESVHAEEHLVFIYNSLALLHGRRGEMDQANETLEKAIAISRSFGDRRQEAHNIRRMATNLIYSHRYAEAMTYARQAAELHHLVGDRAGEVHAINVIGLCQMGMEDCGLAEETFYRTIEMAESIGSIIGMFNPIHNLASECLPQQGKLEQSLRLLETQLAKPAIAGERTVCFILRTIQASILQQLGQVEAARQILLDVLQQKDDPLQRANTLLNLAENRLEAGSAQESRAYIEEARSAVLSSPEPQDPNAVLSIIWFSGLWNLEFGSPAEQQASLEQLTPQAFNKTEIQLQGLALRANLLLALGRTAEALAEVETLLALPAYVKNSNDLSYLFALGRVLHAAGRPEGREYLERAYKHIQLVAGKLDNPEYRAGMFTNRRVRQVLALWQEMNEGQV